MLKENPTNHRESTFFRSDETNQPTLVEQVSSHNHNNNAVSPTAELACSTDVKIHKPSHQLPSASDEAYFLEQLQGVIQSIEFDQHNLRLQQTYGVLEASIDIELGSFDELKRRLMKLYVQERDYFHIKQEEH